MKPHSRCLVRLVVLFILCLVVPSSRCAGPCSFPSLLPFQLGLTWPAVSTGSGSLGAFAVTGLRYFSVDWVVSGSPTCSMTVDGSTSIGGPFTTGSIVSTQNCGSSGSFTASAITENVQAQLSYNITGSGSVTFTIHASLSTSAGSSNTPPAAMGTALIVGNLYDSSGGSLVISNDNGISYSNVTSLSSWQSDGFETLNGQLYGVVGAAGNLSNLSGFLLPTGTGYNAVIAGIT